MEPRTLLAIAPYLLGDIHQGPAGVNVASPIVERGGLAYFGGSLGDVSAGLWKTDGTTAGTTLVKELNSVSDLINVNGTLFFVSSDSANGDELWKSDGTAGGTVLVKDIHSGFLGSSPTELTNVNGTLFFAANAGLSNGEELWKSDGTAAGTVLVKDILPGLFSSSPHELTNVNGLLMFAADDGPNGEEIWKSDGTPAGTVLVKDIRPGDPSAFGPEHLENANGTLFFVANDGTTGVEVWKSDGTPAGTVLVKDLEPGANPFGPSELTNVNGTVFFMGDDGTTGDELWKTDGTAAGTTLVKDIVAGVFTSFLSELTNVNGTLFFSAGGSAWGLWKSDGTTAGTVNLNPAAGIARYLANINGTLYFNAVGNGFELWKSDGTIGGTVQLKDLVPGGGSSSPRYFAALGGAVLFSANDGTNGDELWKTDGTSDGTALVRRDNVSTASSVPRDLVTIGPVTYFAATDAGRGRELWRTDGTIPGTALLKDIVAGPTSSAPSDFVNRNGVLLFAAGDGVSGRELWKSDGTAAGTVLVKDIVPGVFGSNPKNLTVVNGTAFFVARDDTNGDELWKSDGTTAGTVLVRNIRPGFDSSNPRDLINVNGTLFFLANDGINGYELWKSDGSQAGTLLVRSIRTGSSNGGIDGQTAVGSTLFFTANDGTNGYELWKSDGTSAGTVLVKNIRTGIDPSNPRFLTNVGGKLMFGANDGVNGDELWTSDGTSAGTVMVVNLRPGLPSAFPSWLANVNGTVFFGASDGSTGEELWRSDGSAAGTVLVKDIAIGGSSTPTKLVNVGGMLFFAADNGTTGAELWRSDGTGAGTLPVGDLRPGALSSAIDRGRDANGRFLFTADNGLHGRELWVAFDNAPPIANQDRFNTQQNTAVTIASPGIVGNDVDPNNDTLIAALETTVAASAGVLSLNADGSFTFTPATDFVGAASFSYRSSDGLATSAPAVVTINVTMTPNTVPSAAADAQSVTEDSVLQISPTGLVTNDTDANNDTLFAIPATGPAHGSLTLHAHGGFSYSPAANYFGSDSFTYRASDGQSQSLPATVVLTVTPVNDAPSIAVINNPAAILEEAAAQTVNFSGVNAGPGETQVISISATSSNSALIPNPVVTYTSANATGSLSYTPVANQFGTATITVTVTDDGGSAGGEVNQFVRTFTVTVTGVNDAPTLDAITDPAPVLEDAGVQNFTLTGISAGPSESQTLTITATSNNTTLIPNPTITYTNPNATALLAFTPAANQSGTAQIVVRVQDNGGTANSGVNFVTRTFTVNVTPVNDPPTATNESYATTQNVPLYVNAPGVLANDRDVENEPLTAILASGPAQGTLQLNANGSLIYQPANGFTGAVSFTYRARDGQANSVTPATVTINVAAAQPATAGVSGALWNDVNGDGTRTAGEGPVAGGTVYVDLNDNGVRDTLGTLEPDNFAAGASLATVNPRVTLSVVSASLAPQPQTVVALSGGGFASTGSLVLGQGADPFFTSDRRLKLSFTAPVDRVELDFIGGNTSGTEIGVLEIYNAAGKLLNTFATQPRAAGAVERMSLASSKSDIAFAIAYSAWGPPFPSGSGTGRFDNLAFSLTEPSAISAADGTYFLSNLAPGNVAIRQEPPVGHRITAPQVSGRRLFAVDTSPNPDRIVELNPVTGAIIRSINGPTSTVVGDIGLAFDGQTIFYSSDNTSTLYELDPATGAVLDSMALSLGSYVGNLGVSGGNVFTLNWSTRIVTGIDPVTNTIVSSRNWETINDGFFFDDVLGESLATGELVTSTSDYVAFVNPQTGVRVGSIGVTDPFSIESVQVIGDEVYISRSFASKIDVYSRSTGTLLRSLTLSFSPNELAGVGDTSGAQRVALSAGQVTTNIEFGSQNTFGAISGTKWRDGNGNGVRDAGEGALAGQLIYLDQNNNRLHDSGEPTATTAADGRYTFGNVLPGTYSVRAVVPAPFVQSFPTSAAVVRDRLFLSDIFQNKIFELNPQTGAVVNSFPHPFSGQISDGLAFDGRTLYYLNDSNDILYELNPDTGAVLDSKVLPSDSYEGLGTLDGLVYARHGFDEKISVYDPVTNTITRTFTITGAAFIYDGVGEIEDPDRILVRGLFGEIIEVNPVSGAASVSFTAAPDNPYGLTSIGQEIFVGDSNGNINVYSRTGTLLRSFTNTPDVFSLAGGRTPDGGHRVRLGIAQSLTGLDFGTNEVSSMIAVADAVGTLEDVELMVAAPGVLANDIGVVSATVEGGPAHGTLSLLASGGYTYRAALNYHGADSFSYRASDGSAGSVVATVSLTITPVNDPPLAQNDGYAVTEDTPFTVAAPGLVANDADVEQQAISAVLGSGPAHGTVSLLASGGFTYVPQADYVGSDSFTYRPSDGTADGAVATVTLTVAAVNDPPLFTKGPDQASDDETGRRTVAGWASGVAAGPGNETIPPTGQSLTFEVVAANPLLFLEQPAIDAQGTLTYAPKPGATGTAQVTVLLRDSGGTAGGGVDASASQTFAIALSRRRPWYNIVNPLSTTGGNNIGPIDAIGVINYLNNEGGGRVPATPPPPDRMIDVDGNGTIAPFDAILVINYLNALSLAQAPLPEGEGLPAAGAGEDAAGESVAAKLEDVLALLALDVAEERKRRRR